MGVYKEAFEKGVAYGRNVEELTIALNNTWGAKLKSGGMVTSYEKIGYHVGSVEFLNGVFSTGVPVYRWVDEGGELKKVRLTENPWTENELDVLIKWEDK